MRLFKLTDNWQIELERPTVAAIPEFEVMLRLNYNKNISGRGDGDNKGQLRKRAKKEFLYIYFMYDYRSEYYPMDEQSRDSQSRESAGLDPKYKISEEMQVAIQRYIDMQDTKAIRLLKSAYKAIDKVQTYFNNVESDKAAEILSNIAKLGSTVEGLRKLLEQVQKDEGTDQAIRGNQELGRNE